MQRSVESFQVNAGGNISVIEVGSRNDLIDGEIPVCVTEEALIVPNQSLCLVWTSNSYLFDCNGETLIADCGGDVPAAEVESSDGIIAVETGDGEKVTVGLGDIVGEIIEEDVEIGLESGVGCISCCVCAMSCCVSWCCFCCREKVQNHTQTYGKEFMFCSRHLLNLIFVL
ncbi:unnamed protein product [Trifolium pratense]|uniref:Uncharacterized protein n=1 Tax=Trifolium pratense TaxID=57577 RepID=A0ACB0K5Q0_TRIPR|nr:unnamed protein product [Trifolium pratense]